MSQGRRPALLTGLVAGLRRAWPAWLLAALLLLLAIPAYEDLERLFFGLGVITLLVAVAITVFSVRSRSE